MFYFLKKLLIEGDVVPGHVDAGDGAEGLVEGEVLGVLFGINCCEKFLEEIGGKPSVLIPLLSLCFVMDSGGKAGKKFGLALSLRGFSEQLLVD